MTNKENQEFALHIEYMENMLKRVKFDFQKNKGKDKLLGSMGELQYHVNCAMDVLECFSDDE